MILGANVATIEIPQQVKEWAKTTADAFEAIQIAEDYCYSVDACHLPHGPVFDNIRQTAFDFSGKETPEIEVVMTTGVGPHTDCSDGLLVCITLHGSGFKFTQGKTKGRVCDAGDVMYFDDNFKHAMKEPKELGVWIGLICKADKKTAKLYSSQKLLRPRLD